MRRLFFIPILLLGFIFQSCRENIIEFPEPETTATIFIDSTPFGALIFLNDQFTEKTTPNNIQNLYPGEYRVTLKLTNYSDTTFIVTLENGDKPYYSILLNP